MKKSSFLISLPVFSWRVALQPVVFDQLICQVPLPVLDSPLHGTAAGVF